MFIVFATMYRDIRLGANSAVGIFDAIEDAKAHCSTVIIKEKIWTCDECKTGQIGNTLIDIAWYIQIAEPREGQLFAVLEYRPRKGWYNVEDNGERIW